MLVQSTIIKADGTLCYRSGTGYFITSDLVLTACHVLEDDLKALEVRIEDTGTEEDPWREAESTPVWEDRALDAALIRVKQPAQELELPDWGRSESDEDVDWFSTGYPLAGSTSTEAGRERKTVGLSGTLFAQGGRGQGSRVLDLGVSFAPKDGEDWQGISGAPVFVASRFVGFIQSVPTSFGGDRLVGTPVESLLRNPFFLTALATQPEWLQPFPDNLWCLLLRSENADETIIGHIRKAVENSRDAILRAAGEVVTRPPRELQVREVSVNDVLPARDENGDWCEPERFLQFMRLLCAAPVMIVDVSGFQPAVMLLLGIRAVVRRGVTVLVTGESFDETQLSELPFNIQETKLVFSGHEIDNPRHPRKMTATCIAQGLLQLRERQNYLDLPVFDAIRCPEPTAGRDDPSIEDQVFMLCSFQSNYKDHWNFVANRIVATKSDLARRHDADIAVSAVTGEGVAELVAALRDLLLPPADLEHPGAWIFDPDLPAVHNPTML